MKQRLIVTDAKSTRLYVMKSMLRECVDKNFIDLSIPKIGTPFKFENAFEISERKTDLILKECAEPVKKYLSTYEIIAGTIQCFFFRDQHYWQFAHIIVFKELLKGIIFSAYGSTVSLRGYISEQLDIGIEKKDSAILHKYPGWRKEVDSLYTTLTKKDESKWFEATLLEIINQMTQS